MFFGTEIVFLTRPVCWAGFGWWTTIGENLALSDILLEFAVVLFSKDTRKNGNVKQLYKFYLVDYQ
jgi:hypothetical protein